MVKHFSHGFYVSAIMLGMGNVMVSITICALLILNVTGEGNDILAENTPEKIM